MGRFILGIVVGIFLILLFTYLGGGEVLQKLGKMTVEVGERIQVYERVLKDAANEILRKKEVKKGVPQKDPQGSNSLTSNDKPL